MLAHAARILLLGEEPALLRRLRGPLQSSGVDVFTAPDGASVVTVARHLQPDLVLLSWTQASPAGLERCRLLRAASAVPIILITGPAAADDVVAGLAMGADDCVSTSMPVQELVARVEAKLRYAPGWPPSAALEVIAFGAMRIDLRRHSVFVGAREVPLRAKEFALLTLLARHACAVVSYDQILRHVWGRTRTETARARRTVHVHMRWLRTKIEENPGRPCLLLTERHVGYRLVPHDEAAAQGDGVAPFKLPSVR